MNNNLYCVMNTKGGVGKTEITKALAYALAENGEKYKI